MQYTPAWFQPGRGDLSRYGPSDSECLTACGCIVVVLVGIGAALMGCVWLAVSYFRG